MNAEQYKRISAPFRKSDARTRMVHSVSRFLEALFYLAYPVLIASLVLNGPNPSQSGAFNPLLLPCLIVPATGFALVSVLRKLVNAPRPYEALDIDPIMHKDTKGQSFPSKHAFSSLMISLCWLNYLPLIGAILTVGAICLAILRVIAGVHFPKDVIAADLIALALGLVIFLW